MATKQIWFRNSSFRNIKLVNGDDKLPDEVIKACITIDVQAIVNKRKREVVVDAGSICQALTGIGDSKSAEWVKENCPNRMIFSTDDVSILWTEPGVYIDIRPY